MSTAQSLIRARMQLRETRLDVIGKAEKRSEKRRNEDLDLLTDRIIKMIEDACNYKQTFRYKYRN